MARIGFICSACRTYKGRDDDDFMPHGDKCVRCCVEHGDVTECDLTIVTKGKEYDFSRVAANQADGKRSPEAQERLYSKIIQEKRKMAEIARREGNHRGPDGMERVGSIPRELFMARQLQWGKDYWHDGEPIEAKLKREGLHFGR